MTEQKHPDRPWTILKGRAFGRSLRHVLRALPRDYIGTLADIQARHGPLAHWRMFGGALNFAFVSDAQVNRALHVQHAEALGKSPSQVQTFLYAAGPSVATAHGPAWRAKRKEANSLFSRQSVEASCAGQVEVVRHFAAAQTDAPQDARRLARRLAALTSSRGILGRAIKIGRAHV